MKDMNFRLVPRVHSSGPKTSYSLQQTDAVRKFHKSFPVYEPTSLVVLPETAKALGIGNIYVKMNPTASV